MLVKAVYQKKNQVVTMKTNIIIQARTLVAAEMQVTIPDIEGAVYYDFAPTERYQNQSINLVLIPIAYYTLVAG